MDASLITGLFTLLGIVCGSIGTYFAGARLAAIQARHDNADRWQHDRLELYARLVGSCRKLEHDVRSSLEQMQVDIYSNEDLSSAANEQRSAEGRLEAFQGEMLVLVGEVTLLSSSRVCDSVERVMNSAGALWETVGALWQVDGARSLPEMIGGASHLTREIDLLVNEMRTELGVDAAAPRT